MVPIGSESEPYPYMFGPDSGGEGALRYCLWSVGISFETD